MLKLPSKFSKKTPKAPITLIVGDTSTSNPALPPKREDIRLRPVSSSAPLVDMRVQDRE